MAELRIKAAERVAQLHERGVKEAYLYGADEASQPGTEGLNAFFPTGRQARGVQPAARSGSSREACRGELDFHGPRLVGTTGRRGGGSRQHLRKARMTESTDITYYDRPVLKPPVWIWTVPAYFFVGGLAGRL